MNSISNRSIVLDAWGAIYHVKDVQRSIDFYTETLGFNLDDRFASHSGQVSLGKFHLLLLQLTAADSPQMPDSRSEEPNQRNLLRLRVNDLIELINELRNRGVPSSSLYFQLGHSGRRIQIQDPDGNPIEIFDRYRRSRRPVDQNSKGIC